jgi:pyruvate-ferredoxin/flavodoxin oxidoreductase
VIVVMGSGAITARTTAQHLAAKGERVGVLQLRLYRPFPVEAFLAALPATVQGIAVLDRTKEPGAPAEPLCLDVIAALRGAPGPAPRVIGGRYGLSSKEFTPAMVKAVFDELAKPAPQDPFTVGIVDDVTRLSLHVDEDFSLPKDGLVESVFFGLGADGTVGANKNSIKIIGEETDEYAQGYFVYDSKKSGAVTISHLRFAPQPIEAPYLVTQASFVACHQFAFLDRYDVLACAAPGATVLLNAPHAPDAVWDALPKRDAGAAHREAAHAACDRRQWPSRSEVGLGGSHQHDHADLLLRALRRAAARRGDRVHQALDPEELRQEGRHGRAEERGGRWIAALDHLHEIPIPTKR